MSEKNSVVATLGSHNQAEDAVRELQKSGFDMTKLSVVGKPMTSERTLTMGFPRLRFALTVVAAAFLWDGGGLSVGSDSGSLYADELAQGAAVEAAKTPASRERWGAIYVGGAQIGYMHESIQSKEQGGQKVVINENIVVMAISLARQTGGAVAPSATRSKVIVQTEEAESGDILAFRYEVQNPPRLSTRKVGRIANNKMQIETTTRGKVTTSELPWEAAVKGPAHADRLLQQEPLKSQETRTITTFDPRAAAVDTIRFQAGDFENVLLLNGTEKRLLHVVATHSVAPTVVFHEFMDEAGESWKTTIPSRDMVVHMVPKATALKAFAETEEQ